VLESIFSADDRDCFESRTGRYPRTGTTRAVLRLLLIVMTIGMALTTASRAAASLRITAVDASSYPTIRLTVVTSTPISRAPTLEENGAPAVAYTAYNLGRQKSVLVAVDRSQSMHGEPLTRAVAAALTFVAARPARDRLAVLTVARRVVMLTGFSSSTSDAEAALRSIDGVDGRPGTRLWDAIGSAAGALRAEGLPGRVLILVTDGQETTSKATLADAIQDARKAQVVVYPIAIQSAAFSPAPLRELARQTSGAYYGAGSTLTDAYTTIGNDLRRTWRLEYMTAGQPGDMLRLRVAGAGAGMATAAVKLSGLQATGSSQGSGSSSSLLVVIAGVTIAGLAAVLFTGRRRDALHLMLRPWRWR